MTRNAGLAAAIAVVAICAAAQEGRSVVDSGEITFHSSSNLVLVGVTALKNGLPDSTLTRGDFQLFDNGHEVAIKTFDSGARSSTRPLAVWLVVQCNMEGWETRGSGLFAGQISRFEPALKYLDKQDTVAVAHWCDDGQSKLDLPPTSVVEDVVTTLELVLAPVPSPSDHARTGEVALQKTLQLIIDATRRLSPEPVPVVIFLYGDYSGMPKPEADHFIDELLQTSAIAYGLRDRRSPQISSLWLFREQASVANYIAAETGGEYFWVTPETYANGLGEILQRLHLRYELGFEPKVLDGKRHKLRVELAGGVKGQHAGVTLRYRAAYVPLRSEVK